MKDSYVYLDTPVYAGECYGKPMQIVGYYDEMGVDNLVLRFDGMESTLGRWSKADMKVYTAVSDSAKEEASSQCRALYQVRESDQVDVWESHRLSRAGRSGRSI